jgi:hypothetical protein
VCGRKSLHGTTGKVDAILIDVLALESGYLLLGHAVAISGATGIDAFLFGGLRRREGERAGNGVACVERSGTGHKRRGERGDDDKRLLAAFHGSVPSEQIGFE